MAALYSSAYTIQFISISFSYLYALNYWNQHTIEKLYKSDYFQFYMHIKQSYCGSIYLCFQCAFTLNCHCNAKIVILRTGVASYQKFHIKHDFPSNCGKFRSKLRTECFCCVHSYWLSIFLFYIKQTLRNPTPFVHIQQISFISILGFHHTRLQNEISKASELCTVERQEMIESRENLVSIIHN